MRKSNYLCIHRFLRKYEQLQQNILDKMEAIQFAVNNAKREEAKLDCDYNHALVKLCSQCLGSRAQTERNGAKSL